MFTPAFLHGRVAGMAALGGLEISHSVQQFQVVLLGPRVNH